VVAPEGATALRDAEQAVSRTLEHAETQARATESLRERFALARNRLKPAKPGSPPGPRRELIQPIMRANSDR
jgi:hypothetical protein